MNNLRVPEERVREEES